MTSDDKALYSARYILEDLNSEKGMEQLAELSGLPMGVIVSAFENIFNENYMRELKRQEDEFIEKLNYRRFIQTVANGKRPDGTYNYCREALEKQAKELLK